jgi:hypothetical protein
MRIGGSRQSGAAADTGEGRDEEDGGEDEGGILFCSTIVPVRRRSHARPAWLRGRRGRRRQILF